MISKRTSTLLATAILTGTMLLGLLAIQAQAALRHIDGTVVSKNSDNRTFRIVTQNGNKLRIKVNGATKFDRLAGFGALHKGLRVEVDAVSTDGGLLAKQVEPQGEGGGGGDDGPNHT